MTLIAFYHQIILIIGDYVLLGGFKLGNEAFDIFGVDKHLYNEYLINNSSFITDMHSEYIL